MPRTSDRLEPFRNRYRAHGLWFHEIRLRTMLDPNIGDNRPELLKRVLLRAGIGEPAAKVRRVEIEQESPDDIPTVIDWQNVYETFRKQPDDLFVFLGNARIEGRKLAQEEHIHGYCAVITNENWADHWDNQHFEMATDGAFVVQAASIERFDI